MQPGSAPIPRRGGVPRAKIGAQPTNRENSMTPAVQLAVIALIVCGVCVVLLVAAQRQITKLRERADGWRRIAIQFAAELGGG